MKHAKSSFLYFIGCAGLCVGVAGSWADDVPPVMPPPWCHTSIICAGGVSIRDDELAQIIADCILANGQGVHDIKVMFNCCFGGGILDDIGRMCGPGGPLAGTPWVGGAASAWNETAMGWTDAVVNDPANAGKDLGSTWTDALGGKATSPTDNSQGAMRAGSNGNVKRDLERARDKDDSGPNGDGTESPQVASGNGGDGITWTGATSHHAVVFGGDQTDQRHHNNVNNMTDALTGAWGAAPHSVITLDGGTRQQLINAICAAASLLDENEQFVLYIDDHGDFEVDVAEFHNWVAPHIFPAPTVVPIEIPGGYVIGMLRALAQNEPVRPQIWIDLAQPLFTTTPLFLFLNGQTFPLPTGPLSGRIAVDVPVSRIHHGMNQIGIVTSGPPVNMLLERITVWSGPLNDIDKDVQPCLADFNADGNVDFFDYLDFVDAFSSNLMTADFNGDTTIDFFDYLDFVDAFSIGC